LYILFTPQTRWNFKGIVEVDKRTLKPTARRDKKNPFRKKGGGQSMDRNVNIRKGEGRMKPDCRSVLLHLFHNGKG